MIIKKAKKSLGQNFLIDKNIINKIVKIGDIEKDKTVLEIGPGYGNLTKAIANMHPKKIYAGEKDKNLVIFLKKNLSFLKNIEIIEGDFMKIFKQRNFNKNITVFGNLPYNISTQILAAFALQNKWPPWYDSLILMFQKEVADRIIAKSKTKAYGRLAVLCNWRFEIKKHFNITKNCFFPKPKVDSTLLSFRPKEIIQFNIKNPKNLENVTRVLFSNRRKMINKNFAKLFKNSTNVAEELNLNLNNRPEQLSNEMYYKITIKYENLTN